jgi:hypothetical protein
MKKELSEAEKLGLIPKVNEYEATKFIREHFKRKAAENAAIQHRKTLTQYQRGRWSLEKMVRDVIQWHANQGAYISDKQARAYVEGIAHKAEFKSKI